MPVCHAMKPKAEIKRLLEAVRRAEAELEAATPQRAEAGGKGLMRAKAEPKAAQ
jgi:hypothetical protein